MKRLSKIFFSILTGSLSQKYREQPQNLVSYNLRWLGLSARQFCCSWLDSLDCWLEEDGLSGTSDSLSLPVSSLPAGNPGVYLQWQLRGKSESRNAPALLELVSHWPSECYGRARFLSVSGHVLKGSPGGPFWKQILVRLPSPLWAFHGSLAYTSC